MMQPANGMSSNTIWCNCLLLLLLFFDILPISFIVGRTRTIVGRPINTSNCCSHSSQHVQGSIFLQAVLATG
jgi:hypothetical protein